MGKTSTSTQAQPTEEKKTRKVLTAAERIAKLKAEAEALEQREAKRAADKIKGQEERVAQLQSQVDDRQAKLDSAKEELAALRKAAGIEDEAPASA